jgi:hypothetical protein
VSSTFLAVAFLVLAGCSLGDYEHVYTSCDGLSSALLHPPVGWEHPYGEWAFPTEDEASWVGHGIQLMQENDHEFCARYPNGPDISCVNLKTQLLEPDCHDKRSQSSGCM